jgi:hypothetical protein
MGIKKPERPKKRAAAGTHETAKKDPYSEPR